MFFVRLFKFCYQNILIHPHTPFLFICLHYTTTLSAVNPLSKSFYFFIFQKICYMQNWNDFIATIFLFSFHFDNGFILIIFCSYSNFVFCLFLFSFRSCYYSIPVFCSSLLPAHSCYQPILNLAHF